MRSICYAVALLALSPTAHALETSAGSASVNATQVGLSLRVDAANAATIAVMNEVLKCNNKKMIFASDPAMAGKDADGCIAVSGGSDQEIYQEQKTVDIATSAPTTSCINSGGDPYCNGSLSNVNFKGSIPADAVMSDIILQVGYFGTPAGSQFTYQIPLATLTAPASGNHYFYGTCQHSTDSLSGTYSITNGVGNFTAYSCRNSTPPTIGKIVLRYTTYSLRNKP